MRHQTRRYSGSTAGSRNGSAGPSRTRAGYLFVVGATLLLALGVIFVARTNADAIVLVTALAAFIVIVFPAMVDDNYYVFEPLTFVIMSVVLGCTLKAFYLVLYSGQNYTVDEKLLLGLNIESIIFGALVLLVGLACFTFSYFLTKQTSQSSWRSVGHKWSYQKLVTFSFIVTMMSLVSIAVFAARLGISFDGLDSLSAKRFRDDSGAVTASRTGTLDYLLYRIALLAKFPLYILFLWRLKSPFRLMSAPGALLLLAGALSIFVPFFVNNRAGILMPIFDLLIISHLAKGRLDMKLVAGVGTIAVGLVVLGSILRSEVALSGVYDQIFGGRYLIDITKTAHIVNYFRSGTDFLLGSTLIGWVYQLFPFIGTPNEEMVNIGFYLGSEVFGYQASGVPPGIIAELFINFGWYGVVLGMLSFGYILKKFYLKYGRIEYGLESIVIYALVCTRFTVFLFNNGLSIALLKTLLDLIALLVFLRLIRSTKRAA